MIEVVLADSRLKKPSGVWVSMMLWESTQDLMCIPVFVWGCMLVWGMLNPLAWIE
jgi:hypothetical protein